MWRWIGDPWPVDVAGVDVDQLAELGHRDGRAAMLEEARAVVERTRSQALAVARGDLLNDLASDLARGHGPSGQRTVPDTP